MSEYDFSPEENKILLKIEKSFYMQPTLKRINTFINRQTNIKK